MGTGREEHRSRAGTGRVLGGCGKHGVAGGAFLVFQSRGSRRAGAQSWAEHSPQQPFRRPRDSQTMGNRIRVGVLFSVVFISPEPRVKTEEREEFFFRF